LLEVWVYKRNEVLSVTTYLAAAQPLPTSPQKDSLKVATNSEFFEKTMKMAKLVNPMLPSCEMYTSRQATTDSEVYKNKDLAFKIVKVMLPYTAREKSA
jgi:hypothetical protein